VQDYLLEQLVVLFRGTTRSSHDLAASAPSRASEKPKGLGMADFHRKRSSTSVSTIKDAMSLLVSKLQEKQHHILTRELEALLQSTDFVLANNPNKSCRLTGIRAAVVTFLCCFVVSYSSLSTSVLLRRRLWP
jgi:hypothetical protein